MDLDVADRRLRNPPRPISDVVAGVLVTAIWVSGAITMLGAEPSDDTPLRVTLAVAFLVGAAACVVGSYRTARTAVHVRPWGLVVVNPLRTHRLDWEETVVVGLESRDRHPCIGVVHLADGSEIRLHGVECAPVRRRSVERAVAIVEELNDLIDRGQAAAPAG